MYHRKMKTENGVRYGFKAFDNFDFFYILSKSFFWEYLNSFVTF